jgi:hypothetical protein
VNFEGVEILTTKVAWMDNEILNREAAAPDRWYLAPGAIPGEPCFTWTFPPCQTMIGTKQRALSPRLTAGGSRRLPSSIGEISILDDLKRQSEPRMRSTDNLRSMSSTDLAFGYQVSA